MGCMLASYAASSFAYGDPGVSQIPWDPLRSLTRSPSVAIHSVTTSGPSMTRAAFSSRWLG